MSHRAIIIQKDALAHALAVSYDQGVTAGYDEAIADVRCGDVNPLTFSRSQTIAADPDDELGEWKRDRQMDAAQ
jgi:hypothetical protein